MRVLSSLFSAVLLLAGVIAASPAQAQVTLFDYQISYGGKSYDSNTNQTTFTYTVTPGIAPQPGHNLNYFQVELPVNCLPALNVVGSIPADSVATPVLTETDPATGIFGAKFDFVVDQDLGGTFSFTLAGDIPELNGRVAVTHDDGTNDVGIAMLTTPGCPVPANPGTITPIVECVEDLGGGSYLAHFGYESSNPHTVTLAIDSDSSAGKNLFSPGTAAQPAEFLPGRHVNVFTQLFDGTDITWTVQYAGAAVQVATANSASESCQGIVPIVNCIERIEQNGWRAHFSYYNLSGSEVTIPAGASNFFSTDGSVNPNQQDRGQPTTFAPGLVTGPFALESQWVQFPVPAGEVIHWNGTPMTWSITNNGVTRTATASSNGLPCYLWLKPVMGCVEKSCDGSITASWGYFNDAEFDIFESSLNVGFTTNYFDPAPVNRGQPGNFDPIPENRYPFKSTDSAAELEATFFGTLSWHLGTTAATADADSKRLCSPNQAPACNSSALNGAVYCDGLTPKVNLTGTGTDPDGTCTKYSWSTNCAGATVDTPDASSATSTVSFANQPQSCVVTLNVSDEYVSSPCAPVNVQISANQICTTTTTTTTSTTTTSTTVTTTTNSSTTLTTLPKTPTPTPTATKTPTPSPTQSATPSPTPSCESSDVSTKKAAVDAGTLALQKLVNKAGKLVVKNAGSDKNRKLVASSKKSAAALYAATKSALAAVPQSVSTCTGVNASCVTVQFDAQLGSVSANTAALQKLVNKLLKKLPKSLAKTKSKLAAQAKTLAETAAKDTAGLPASSTTCA